MQETKLQEICQWLEEISRALAQLSLDVERTRHVIAAAEQHQTTE